MLKRFIISLGFALALSGIFTLWIGAQVNQNFGVVSLATPGPIGGTTPSTGAFTQVTINPGSFAAPSLLFSETSTNGLWSAANGSINVESNGFDVFNFNATQIRVNSGTPFGFTSSTPSASGLDTAFSRISAGVIGVGTGGAGSVAGTLDSGLYQTGTKCAAAGTTASPSVIACGAAPAGVVSCNDTVGGICQVNTSAMISANSTVIVEQDEATTTGTLLGVTCSVTPSVINPGNITAKVAATSFTFKETAGTTLCYDYWIIN